MAFAEILQGFRRLLLRRKYVRLYAPPIIWGLTLIAVLAQTWWAMFSLREHSVWTFATYGIVLLQTIVLYMVAAVALPETDDAVDMRVAYFEHARPFFLLICAAAAASISKDLIIDNRLPSVLNLAFQLAFATLAAIAAFVRRSWYHQILAPMIAGAFGFYIVSLFSRL